MVLGMNFGAVVVAALATFLLGGPWYSDLLFKKAWMRAAGRSSETPPEGAKHPAFVFGGSFLFALAGATVFGLWLGPNPPLDFAVTRGLMAGGMVACAF
jgi:hypothetical protein